MDNERGQRVLLVTTDEIIYEGIVRRYVYPGESWLEGEDAVILDCPGYKDYVGFSASEIKSIEVI